MTTSPTPYENTPWALTGNVWTQRAGETDLLFGVVEVRNPSSCEAQDQYGYAYANLLIDGEFVGSAYASFYPGAENRTQRVGIYFYPAGALMAPDADTAHVVTARVYDSCKGAEENFTFKALQLDVVGAS